MADRNSDDVMRDVMAFVTAAIAGDEDAVFALVVNFDDPVRTLVGVAGLLAEVLPAWATQLGIEDLSEMWRDLATRYSLELEIGGGA